MTVDPRGPLDKRRVRLGFARNASRYDSASFLAREVGTRMGERLDLLRAAPVHVLDLGSATGVGAQALRARYPGSVVTEVDFAFQMLAHAAGSMPWWRRGLQRLKPARGHRVCADVERLPLRSGAFDMVWSNLALHWTDPSRVLGEVRRVLAPGGVFMFSTLGPDTLRELRASYAAADDFDHVNRFVDLHDIGDMLVGARFADPVMDMEYLTLTYESVDALLAELRSAGGRNANQRRRAGLGGRAALAAMRARYETLRRDARLPATVEVVYGHAWRPQVERDGSPGESVVAFHPRAGRSPGTGS